MPNQNATPAAPPPISYPEMARANPKAASALALSLLNSPSPETRAQGAALAAPCMALSFSRPAPDIAGTRLLARMLSVASAEEARSLARRFEKQIQASLSRLLPLLDSAACERLGEALPQAFKNATPATLSESVPAFGWALDHGLLSLERQLQVAGECAQARHRASHSPGAKDTSAPLATWLWMSAERPAQTEALIRRWITAKPKAPESPFLRNSALDSLLAQDNGELAGRLLAHSEELVRPSFLNRILDLARQPGSAGFFLSFTRALRQRLVTDPRLEREANQAFAQSARALADPDNKGALAFHALDAPRSNRLAFRFIPMGWSDLPILLARGESNRSAARRYPHSSEKPSNLIIAVLQGMREGDPNSRLLITLAPERSGMALGAPLGHLCAHVALLAAAPGLPLEAMIDSAERGEPDDARALALAKSLPFFLNGLPQARALIEACSLRRAAAPAKSHLNSPKPRL